MNKLVRISTYLLLSSMLMLSACDIIEEPVVQFEEEYRADLYGNPPVFPIAVISNKNVLVEDFTAHQCGNCPPAAELAEAIAEANPDRVCVMAIHAGNLAVTSKDYPMDWTNEVSEVFWDQLYFQANPLGRVNRKGGSGNFLAPAEWIKMAEMELETETPVTLQAETSWYPSAGHLNIHVNGQFFSSFEGDIRLSVLVIESHLIGDQLDYSNSPEHIEDYEFNHLLRGSVSGANGLVVITDAELGNSFQSDFTFNWNEDWIFENSSLIIIASSEDGSVVNCIGHHLGE